MTRQTQQTNGAEVIVDALIDGLRVSDSTLNDKCICALQAIGPRVIPLLSAAASAATSAVHRRRIIDAIDLIEDMGQLREPIGGHVWSALLDSLRVHNDRLNEKAIAALSYLPDEQVHELLAEATYQRRRKGYSERLMRAAMYVGQRRHPPQA